MLRVAMVTIKRLLLDKVSLIALFIVPIIIIVVFSNMTAMDKESIGIKVGVLEEQAVYLEDRANITLLKADSMEALQAYVTDSKVSASLVFEQGEVSKVYATSSATGEYVVSFLEQPPVKEIPKATPEQRIQVILNFLINYMMFSMMFIASDIVMLKKKKIMMRISSMPLSSVQVFSGHVLAFLSLLTIQLFIVNIAVYIIVGAPIAANMFWGLLILVLMTMIVLSLGLLVTRLTSNLSLVPLLGNALMIPLMMASGSFMPVDAHPILSKVRYITPQYWVLDAMKSLNSGHGEVLLHAVVLLTMGLLVFSIALVGQSKDKKSFA